MYGREHHAAHDVIKCGGGRVENEVTSVARQSAPPVAISAVSLLGVQLSDWVYIFTLIYLFLQIIHLGLKLFKAGVSK